MNNGWLWGWEMNEVGIWDEVVLVLLTWASFQNQKTQKATSNWLFQNFSLGSLFSLWPQLCSWLHLASHQTTHTPAWTWESGLVFWFTRQGQEFGWLWESAELVLHILTTPYFFILLIHKEENQKKKKKRKKPFQMLLIIPSPAFVQEQNLRQLTHSRKIWENMRVQIWRLGCKESSG